MGRCAGSGDGHWCTDAQCALLGGAAQGFRHITSLDSSNHVTAVTGPSSVLLNREKVRHHNGTNWTTTASAPRRTAYVATHADTSVSGFPYGSATSNATEADIFGTSRQGLRCKFGSKVFLDGVCLRVSKSG